MTEPLESNDLTAIWSILGDAERAETFQSLGHREASKFFASASAGVQHDLLRVLPPEDRRTWLRQLEPDDAADLIQRFPVEEQAAVIAMLDAPTAREVRALLTHAADAAGGLMSPRFAQVRPDMTVEAAIAYVRRQSRTAAETVYYVFVTDVERHLLGVVSCRELLTAPAQQPVSELMRRDVVSVRSDAADEDVARLIEQHDLLAIPVVDAQGRIEGIVTVDDVIDVVRDQATADMQKVGGMEALGAPYLQIGLRAMLKKRAAWLAMLFVGEMLTASAMGHFEDEIGKSLALALFVPLIISSGGNSGSQATTLVIRSMALGELRLTDWLFVLRRELLAGGALGIILAVIGLARIAAWQGLFGSYGENWLRLGAAVAISLVCVVAWGTLTGAMLPFLLRRAGFDPASSSAPFVATIVDVSGLVIYFNVAAALVG